MEQNILYRNHRIRIVQDSDLCNPRTDWDNLGTLAAKHRRYTLHDKGFDMDGDALREHFTSDIPESLSTQVWIGMHNGWYDHRCHHTDRWRKIKKWLHERVTKLEDAYIQAKYTYLPVYAYEHGGITLSTGSFSCRWDSGQVGIIFCSLEDARKNWMLDDTATWDTIMTGDWANGRTLRECTNATLKSEIKTFDQYLTGDVYGFKSEESAGIVDEENLDEDNDYHWDNELDSCWGFYGDEGVKEAIEQAEGSIDYHIDTYLPEQARKLAAMEASVDKIWAQ